MRALVKVVMNPTNVIIRDKGLQAGGRVQMFHTANVLRRIQKYMPKDTSTLIKSAINQTDIRKPYIIIDTPYAKYQYYGKVMIGPAPKVVTDRPLNYSTAKNPLAGPFWDRRLSVAEGRALSAELQRYIDMR